MSEYSATTEILNALSIAATLLCAAAIADQLTDGAVRQLARETYRRVDAVIEQARKDQLLAERARREAPFVIWEAIEALEDAR